MPLAPVSMGTLRYRDKLQTLPVVPVEVAEVA
jgi:hypothetical protein